MAKEIVICHSRTMGFVVYILKSESAGRFYIGQTDDLNKRLDFHNRGEADKFTRRFRPWMVFHLIPCHSRKQAKLIEAHIKRMKSTKYIRNLAQYPEMNQKLLDTYPVDASDC